MGAPARTSKPKFRVDAANELIKGEPAPRDDVQLLAFANARLGKTVFEFHDVTVAAGERPLVDHLTWDVGPGQRVGILGSNGTGTTSHLAGVMLQQMAGLKLTHIPFKGASTAMISLVGGNLPIQVDESEVKAVLNDQYPIEQKRAEMKAKKGGASDKVF